MNTESLYSHVTVGSIFAHDKWFFQVVKRSGNTIYTRRIKGRPTSHTGMKSEDFIPIPNSIDPKYQKTYRSKIKEWDKDIAMSKIDHLDCYLWVD